MSWICPHCGTTATLQTSDVEMGSASEVIATAPNDEGICLSWQATRCPSKQCGKYVLDVWAKFGVAVQYQHGGRTGQAKPDENRPFGIGFVRFEPRVGVPLSMYAAKVVVDDYNEACLIKDLSPKAAATLCRRALQGMIRDYWGVSKSRLADELQAIKGSCDSALYDAMMSLKAVGNIGAHPERDISTIIDVEEGEVDALLKLLQILDKEWYVAKAKRAEALAAVAALGAKSAVAAPIAVASLVPPVSP